MAADGLSNYVVAVIMHTCRHGLSGSIFVVLSCWPRHQSAIVVQKHPPYVCTAANLQTHLAFGT